ncbi:MAG: dihydropteroate synthase [Candidatus Cloacimonadaceae bacterium]
MLIPEHIIHKLFKEKPLPLVMGILNVTPDSFSDGNHYLQFDQALEHAKHLIDTGADLIDIGGESTRPGSQAVSSEQEIHRVIPVIEAIRKFSEICISVDTRKHIVAKYAIQAGAEIVNDISALRYDKNMVELLNDYPQVGIILMHMQGEPSTMQEDVHYNDVVENIMTFFQERLTFCNMHGIVKSRIFLDPGIGFGKYKTHNLSILANLEKLNCLNLPLVVGASRKRFINDIFPSEPSDRLAGSLAATQACLNAEIDIIRVHDVREHIQYIKVSSAIKSSKQL